MCPFIWKNFNSLHPRLLCLVEIVLVVLKKNINGWKVTDIWTDEKTFRRSDERRTTGDQLKQAKVQQDNCFCLFVCISSHQALMIMVIEQWGFFSVPHLLWHGTLVYNGNLRGPVTVTPVVEFWQWSYIVQNLKPFTGNGDVSIWVDNSRVERITQNKQTNQTKQTLPV